MHKKQIDRRSSRQTVPDRHRQTLLVAVLVLVIIVVLGASYCIMEIVERRAYDSAEKLVSDSIRHIDAKMDGVRDAVLAEADHVQEIMDDPEALVGFTHDFVSGNEFIIGSTVAFKQGVFDDRDDLDEFFGGFYSDMPAGGDESGLSLADGRYFAPYSYTDRESGEVVSSRLGMKTDYFKEEWYVEAITEGKEKEYWCEPYEDEGGAGEDVKMCTFSIPLKNRDGEYVAVLTADVDLKDLAEYISSITPYPDSYIVLRSQKGAPIVNGETEADGAVTTSLKGKTGIGWSVELQIPFTYLMHGDTGGFLIIGSVFLLIILFVYIVNRLLYSMQKRASDKYMNVIDAVAGGYSSIYQVDLMTNDTVVFRDPGEYSDVIGDVKDSRNGFVERITRLIDYDCHPDDREMMKRETAPVTICLNLLDQDRYQVRFRKEHDGDVRWYEMHVIAMERNDSGAPVLAVIAFIDVNESIQKEKETQDTLKQALEMAESANNAKTTFLFNMSHDIRTPMNAIIGFTNMAKKHIDDREKVLDCLDKTQQSSNLLLMLINSVLDVSRIESGRAELDESAADVEYSFAAIQDTMTELAAARDISISFEIGEIRNRYVWCDLNRCNRVFVNIISNAIKFTPEGGTVRVRCEQTDSDREGWGNYRYTFEDNGIGMSEEFQKNIFEQFAREKTSTVSGIEGSGLGLAVCKSFVDLMEGKIEYTSKVNEGTVFVVTLPFRIQQGMMYVDPYTREEIDASESKDPAVHIVLRGRRVLLVEDNELNREIAGELLEDEGLTVDTAEDGAEAVRIMEEKGPYSYDFILMDIQMPVMDGYEATKAIRQMYPDAAIPIIAVSANAFEEDRKASKAAGMNDHVAKPIKVQELFSVLAKYM